MKFNKIQTVFVDSKELNENSVTEDFTVTASDG
jgi:hypothetical protein